MADTFPTTFPHSFANVESVTATQTAVTGTMNTASAVVPTVKIDSTQVSAAGTMNAGSLTEFATSTQVESLATVESGAVSMSEPAVQVSGTGKMNATTLTTIEPVAATQVASLSTMNAAQTAFNLIETATQPSATASMQSGSVSMSQPASSVSTTVTPNTVGPLDESIGSTQVASVADSNIGSLSDFNLSAQRASSAASMNGLDVWPTSFKESAQTTVSASQNDGRVSAVAIGADEYIVTATANDGSITLLSLLSSPISADTGMNLTAVERIRHIYRQMGDTKSAEISNTQNSSTVRATVNEVE